MMLNPRIDFFDGIADQWDGWEDLVTLGPRLAAGFRELGIQRSETILDVGCGTGNLTRALLDWLSPEGRVVAMDLSPRMLERAKAKVRDPRVTWLQQDIDQSNLPDAFCDRVMCYSVWPHFDDPDKVAKTLHRVLRPEGYLHIWHLLSRQKVNEIHAGAGVAVHQDTLPSAPDVANLLTHNGFQIRSMKDDPTGYLITAHKNPGSLV
jgi:demethylmenaquinone methyltransferase/2-methoxy-6-polyprenyl-1,4-benzoquinol methylase